MQGRARRTRCLHQPQDVVTQPFHGRFELRARQCNAVRRRAQLDFGRDLVCRGECLQPGRQQVVQTLLGRRLVQRIEPRLAHERRCDALGHHLPQGKHAGAGQQLVARPAQHTLGA